MVKELVGLGGAYLQEPNDLLFDHPYQSKILGLLLISEDHHAVVGVLHLVILQEFLASVEVIL